MAVTSNKKLETDVQHMKGNKMRTYTKQIPIQHLIRFFESVLREEAKRDLNWRLDQWICDQVQKDYPEVDWVFEYTHAKEIDAEIEIAVDFDIDQYRELKESVRLRQETKSLREAIKGFSKQSKAVSDD